MGNAKVANVIMLGALLEETECLPVAQALSVIQNTVKKSALMELNQKALEAGRQFIDQQVRVGAVSQPDGFAY
jgi:Pyruvate/2-oxoacid:ferredoxin oxidoreductase gamma subunit